MNYASLNEVYDTKTLKQRENSYDNIIKNLLNSQNSEPSLDVNQVH